MFISENSISFLKENGFSIIQNHDSVTISHQKSFNILWPILSMVLALAFIPIIAFGNYKLGLFVFMLLIFPAYKAIKELKQPRYVEINAKQKYVLIKNKLGNNDYHDFNNMKGLSLSTMDETLEPNAFQDEVVVKHYFIDLNFEDNSSKTIMSFKEVEMKPVEVLINELKSALVKPKMA